jgi:hypothetical protein
MKKLRKRNRTSKLSMTITIAILAFGFLYLTWQHGRSFGKAEVRVEVPRISHTLR